MVGGVGKPDIDIANLVIPSWLPPNTYVFGESVRNIKLDLDLTPVVPGLAELRDSIGTFYQDLAEQNRDAYLLGESIDAKIIADAVVAQEMIRICP